MKKNKLTIILILIIIILLGFIIYERIPHGKNEKLKEEEKITLKDNINLDYVSIYLTSDGLSYIVPLKEDEINKLEINKNLKERLKTLYTKAFYYDIYVANYKIKGFKIKLDSKITKIYQLAKNNNTYLIFLKENNTIGIWDYEKYLDDLNVNVQDNYNNYQNVQEILNDQIIYLDGRKESLKLD